MLDPVTCQLRSLGKPSHAIMMLLQNPLFLLQFSGQADDIRGWLGRAPR